MRLTERGIKDLNNLRKNLIDILESKHMPQKNMTIIGFGKLDIENYPELVGMLKFIRLLKEGENDDKK